MVWLQLFSSLRSSGARTARCTSLRVPMLAVFYFVNDTRQTCLRSVRSVPGSECLQAASNCACLIVDCSAMRRAWNWVSERRRVSAGRPRPPCRCRCIADWAPCAIKHFVIVVCRTNVKQHELRKKSVGHILADTGYVTASPGKSMSNARFLCPHTVTLYSRL